MVMKRFRFRCCLAGHERLTYPISDTSLTFLSHFARAGTGRARYDK